MKISEIKAIGNLWWVDYRDVLVISEDEPAVTSSLVQGYAINDNGWLSATIYGSYRDPDTGDMEYFEQLLVIPPHAVFLLDVDCL